MKSAALGLFLIGLWWPSQPTAVQESGFEETRVVLDSDGWQLVGDLLLAADEQPQPAVLLLNKAAGNREIYRELARHLAGRGIASLRLDLRGHGESTNLGRFVPSEDQSFAFLVDTEADVVAAHRYLASHPGVDADRIGIVGASYSGEFMAIAGREHGYAKAYVALSPGSFSNKSMRAIDLNRIPYLFVKSVEERHLRGFEKALRKRSKTAEILIVPGKEHATRLLGERPDLAERIAVWLSRQLRK